MKNITLMSSHSKDTNIRHLYFYDTVLLISEKPRPQQLGEEPGHMKSAPGGTPAWQRKGSGSPTPVPSTDVVPPQSLLGPIPVTSKPSAPYGSVRKGRTTNTVQSGKGANPHQQTEHSQKQDSQKRRHGMNQSPVGGGRGSAVAPIEPTPQQVQN